MKYDIWNDIDNDMIWHDFYTHMTMTPSECHLSELTGLQ